MPSPRPSFASSLHSSNGVADMIDMQDQLELLRKSQESIAKGQERIVHGQESMEAMIADLHHHLFARFASYTTTNGADKVKTSVKTVNLTAPSVSSRTSSASSTSGKLLSSRPTTMHTTSVEVMKIGNPCVSTRFVEHSAEIAEVSAAKTTVQPAREPPRKSNISLGSLGGWNPISKLGNVLSSVKSAKTLSSSQEDTRSSTLQRASKASTKDVQNIPSFNQAILLAPKITARKRRKLIRTIMVNQEMEARAAQKRRNAEERCSIGLIARLRKTDKEEMETWVDSFMSLVIAVNAVFLGASIDHNRDEGAFNAWQFIDLGFTVIFVTELSCKIRMHGLKGQFCTKAGRGRTSNIFDANLILLDTLQMLWRVFFTGNTAGIPSASLFRLIRLARLTRMIRLLRYEKFNAFLAMVQGITSGALTLFWAVVVFILMVYVMALVCRELLGETPEPNIYEYFSNVPRSMLTVFRCSFGDCTSSSGFPIPEHISNTYGGGYALAYCCFVFFITVGLFNVISAIFVDSTLVTAADLNAQKTQERLLDEERWAGAVSTILEELLSSTPFDAGRNWLDSIEELMLVEFTPEALDAIRFNDKIRRALTRLDIDTHDFHKLSDILDPDQSGTIGVLELINGLDRLRGEPRRSDVVAVDLMIRNLMEMVDELLHITRHQQRRTANSAHTRASFDTRGSFEGRCCWSTDLSDHMNSSDPESAKFRSNAQRQDSGKAPPSIPVRSEHATKTVIFI